MDTRAQALAGSKGICEHCLGELLWDEGSSEWVCSNCGAVSESEAMALAQVAAVRGGSRSVESSASSSIARDIGVSTVIGYSDFDASGRQLEQSRDLRQLRKLDMMVAWDSRKRRLGRVSMEVQKAVRCLGLNPALGERAFKIYLKEFDAKSIRIRSLSAVAAACVCMACRQMDVARPPNDLVAKRVDVNEKKFRHYYRILLSTDQTRSIPSPAKYIPSVAAKASIGGAAERMAVEILGRVSGHPRLVGKRPVSLAAAALYIASVKSGDRTTQLKLAYAAGVTPITIRKRTVEISEILSSLSAPQEPQGVTRAA